MTTLEWIVLGVGLVVYGVYAALVLLMMVRPNWGKSRAAAKADRERLLCLLEWHAWRQGPEYGEWSCKRCGVSTHVPLDRMG